jgi:hypothetical protein
VATRPVPGSARSRPYLHIGFIMCLALPAYFAYANPYHIYVDESYFISQSYALHFGDSGDYRSILDFHPVLYPYVLGYWYYVLGFLGLDGPSEMLYGVRAAHMLLAVAVGYFGTYALSERLYRGSGVATAFLTSTSMWWLQYELHVMKDLVGVGLMFFSLSLLYDFAVGGGRRKLVASSALYCLSWFTTHSMAIYFPGYVAILILSGPGRLRRSIPLFLLVQFAGLALIGAFDRLLFGDFLHTYVKAYTMNFVDRVPALWFNQSSTPANQLLLIPLQFKPLILFTAASGAAVLAYDRRRILQPIILFMLPYAAILRWLYIPRLGYLLILSPLVFFLSAVLADRAEKARPPSGRCIIVLLAVTQLMLLPPFSGLERPPGTFGKGDFADLFVRYFSHSQTFNTFGSAGIPRETDASRYSCADFSADFLRSQPDIPGRPPGDVAVLVVPPCYLPVFSFKPYKTVFVDINVNHSAVNDRYLKALESADYMVASPYSLHAFTGWRVYQEMGRDGRFEPVAVNKSGDDRVLQLVMLRRRR